MWFFINILSSYCATLHKFGVLFAFGLAMLSRLIMDIDLLCADSRTFSFTESRSYISTVANVPVGAGSVVRHLLPCSVDEYISLYVPRLAACRFATMPHSQNLTINISN